jgi:uncharacterized protein (DUF342 family)
MSDGEETILGIMPKIIGKGKDHWKVLIHLTFDELLDNRKLLTKLLELKKYVAETEDVPLPLLNYEGIIERRQLENEMQVTVKIVRLPVEKGEPEIHLLEQVCCDGTPYADMKAMIDIYPLDSLDQTITYQKVLLAMRNSGISEELVNPWFIRQKVQQAAEKMVTQRDIPVATGTLPESGEDAKLDFFFPARPAEGGSAEYYGSRRVRKGDLICRKIPAKDGKKPGCNVKGKVIAPRKGQDIELHPEQGVTVDFDKQVATADIDGMVVIRIVEIEKRLPHGKKLIPSEVVLKVNSVVKVQGNKVVNLTTNDAVEVQGNLHIGSRIITDGEIHVTGSVEEESVLRALDDITVEGDVHKADLSSDSNVVTQGNVTDSKVVAKDKVVVGGGIQRTRVVGKHVDAKRISGSDVVAEQGITVDSLDDDESQLVSSIAVGVREFLQERCQENREFLEQARCNLERITNAVGESFTRNLTHSNMQQQWVQLCAKIRRENKFLSHGQMADLKALFQNIPTLKTMIKEKQKENEKVEKRMAESPEGETMIVVREKVGKSQEVSVNGVSQTLLKSDSGARIESSGK